MVNQYRIFKINKTLSQLSRFRIELRKNLPTKVQLPSKVKFEKKILQELLFIMMFPEQWMSSELGKILGFDPSEIVK